MKLFESGEDYLEEILILENENGQVRSIDIANAKGFSKPSVSVAMKKLKEAGYIVVDDNGLITLTEEGRKVATHIYERHIILTDFFVSLGVDREIAAKDACKVEHDLSEETFQAIKNVIKK